MDAALAGALAASQEATRDGLEDSNSNDLPSESRRRDTEFRAHVACDAKIRKKLKKKKFDKLDDYFRAGKLGEGTYGFVCKGMHQPTKTTVALKKIKPDLEEVGIQPTTIREVSLLEELSQHPYIVTMFCIIFDRNAIYLVFEFLEYDLRKYMDKVSDDAGKADVGLPIEQVKRFQFQMCKAIEFCHKNRVLHRDLKPQNILVDKDGTRIKVADFGLAREHGLPIDELTREVVTLWYRAPEVLMGSRIYNGGIDTWALGCILWEMLNGAALFPADCEIDALFKIFSLLGTPTGPLWPDWKTLPNYQDKFPRFKPKDLVKKIAVPELSKAGMQYIRDLLTMDPVLRMNSKGAAAHTWLNEPSPEPKALEKVPAGIGRKKKR